MCVPCGTCCGCANSDPKARSVNTVRSITKSSCSGGAVVGLATGASLSGCCGIGGGICCSLLPGCCQYKMSSCVGCGPRYEWYFLARSKHIDRSGADLEKMRAWIEKGWVKTEVSAVVGMDDIDVGIARMDPSYRTFGMSASASSRESATPPMPTPGMAGPHRGKIVVRLRNEK